MARPSTVVTELMVAFGILELEPAKSEYKDVARLFSETLEEADYNVLLKELRDAKNITKYKELWEVGNKLRKSIYANTPISKIEWHGKKRQMSTVTISKDLCVNSNSYISVKADSDVVFNLSPFNLFTAVPSGVASATREENWFLKAAPQAYQNLYLFVRKILLEEKILPEDVLPETAADFEKKASKKTRKAIQKKLEKLNGKLSAEFTRLYRQMCHDVALYSANTFSENRLNVRTTQMRGADELILKTFLRLNSAPYFLAGSDGGKIFAVEIPDITRWSSQWNLEKIEPSADTSRGQCVVNITLHVKNKNKKSEVIELPYHAEIRWSHGKFCGNPEGKLYKDFKWLDKPVIKNIFT